MGFGLTTGFIPLALYLAGILALLLAIFWRPIAGLYYLVPLIVLQTLRYRMNEYPLAQSVVTIMLLGMALGLLRRREWPIVDTPWTRLLLIYWGYTLFSLCLGSFIIGAPLPFPGEPRFGVWLDYMNMPALLLLVAAIAPDRRHAKAMVFLMCFSALVLNWGYWDSVHNRDYSQYSDSVRESAGMGYAGLNGMASFAAQFAAFLIALASFKSRWFLKAGYYALAAFSAVCLMYTFSRGAYVAFAVGVLFVGFAKNRMLLIVILVFALSWTAFVPGAVQDRIFMTYESGSGDVDHSSETRLRLWEDALDLFTSSNVLFGMGFNTYASLHRVGTYEDTHNIYVKVLLETGIIGMFLFLWLLGKSFRVGWRVFRRSNDPFMASLGLGLAVWILCSAVSSCFGDRWMYFQVNGDMWVLAGLISQTALFKGDGDKAGDEIERENDGETEPALISHGIPVAGIA